MKIIWKQNPLLTEIMLDTELDVSVFRENIYNEQLEWFEIDNEIDPEEETGRLLPYMLSALSEIHCGDCTKVPCGCTKCHAEGFAGTNTLLGIRHPYYVNEAFSEDRESLDKAIAYLKNNPAKVTREGSEKHVEKWQLAKNETVEDLIKYKHEHFKDT